MINMVPHGTQSSECWNLMICRWSQRKRRTAPVIKQRDIQDKDGRPIMIVPSSCLWHQQERYNTRKGWQTPNY